MLVHGVLFSGQLVEIQGLKSASHLNGSGGILVRYIENDQRWAVRLAKKTVKVKPENLKAAPYGKQLLFNLNFALQSHVASYLAPRDLLHLALTSRHFGWPSVHNGDDPSDTSLIEKIVKQTLAQELSEDEKRALPRIETQSYLSLYQEFCELRSPLQFDHLFAEREIKYLDEDEKWLVFSMAEEEDNDDLPTAVSDHVMRAGKHYCTITVTDNKVPCITAGVTRSIETLDRDFASECGEGWDPVYHVSTYAQWDSDVHCCMYNGASANAMWVGWSTEDDDPLDQIKYPEITNWNGMETLPPGSILGLLLDLDNGTLAVYKDGRRLGVIKDGLSERTSTTNGQD
ncbi:hypothetical protein ACHAXR_001720 [Thalassiosira sp. AJA248-18]